MTKRDILIQYEDYIEADFQSWLNSMPIQEGDPIKLMKNCFKIGWIARHQIKVFPKVKKSKDL